MINRVVTGVVVIIVGFILLMNTTGKLPWYVWEAALAYWPVILIGIGIQILFSRWRVPGIALAIIAMLVLAVLDPFGLGGYPLRHYRFNPRMVPRRIITVPTDFHEKTVEVPLTPSLTALSISGDFPVCEFGLRGDPEVKSGETNLVLQGTVSWSGVEPRTEVSTSPGGPLGSGETAVLVMDGSGSAPADSAKYRCDFRLNPSIPAAIRIDSGVVTADIDGSKAALDRVEIEGGVVDLKIRYGLSGRPQILLVDAGVISLDITVDKECGFKIRVSGPPLVVRNNFSQVGLVKEGDYWVTTNYSKAKTRLDVTISSGAGNITVHRISW
ncbi:MAG TPA: hypothetical protein GX510_10010 [Firmicutes bacterium]|nr:hypothetical protein [Candidatus Fermentithermobacillaceae bacterium]